MKSKEKRNKHIPLRHYKVFLLQMASRIIEKVTTTGLKPSSKRARLASEIAELSAQLEREFKRDSTLASATVAKKELYDELFTGGIPEWLLDVLFNAIVEESHKMNKHKKAS